MPDVISNTTPLFYLHQLGCLDLLPQLYQQVFVPQAVVDELLQGELKGFDVPRYAQTLGIRFTGTLGVLVKAKQSGRITAIRPWIEQLERLGFYVGAHVRAMILSLAGESP